MIRELYDLAKKMIPGCVVEDDSSWIEWNRINDFFDDHPYGNNHTWVKTLHRLRDYAEAQGAEAAPARRSDRGRHVGRSGAAAEESRQRTALLAAGLPRRQQEVARSDAITVRPRRIRPARIGFEAVRDADAQVPDRDVSPRSAGRRLRRQRAARLSAGGNGTDRFRRSAQMASRRLGLAWRVTDRTEYRAGSPLVWKWEALKATIHEGNKIHGHDELLPTVNKPLRHEIRHGDSSWPVWLVPSPDAEPAGVLRATRLTPSCLSKLEAGAKVLLLPDGERGSFPLRDHWFLRGGPYLPDHPLWQTCAARHDRRVAAFRSGGRVIPDIGYFDEIDPIVLLWDNHDIKEVKTHALVFETRVGQGRLLVSALNHRGFTNAAGQWLREWNSKNTWRPARRPNARCGPRRSNACARRLNEKKIDLTKETWRFKPDPKNVGVDRRLGKARLEARRQLEHDPRRQALGRPGLAESRRLGVVSARSGRSQKTGPAIRFICPLKVWTIITLHS